MRRSWLGSLLLVVTVAVPAAGAPALSVSLSVTNRESVARPLQPVSGGVPFAKGAVRDVTALRLLSKGSEIPAQFLATAKWPDGSIRWALVDTEVDLPPSGTVPLVLEATPPASFKGLTVVETPASITVDTGATRQVFNRDEFKVGQAEFIVTVGGKTYKAVPTSFIVEESGPMKVVLRADGVFMGPALLLDNDLIRFRARITMFSNRQEMNATVTFRNRTGFNWSGTSGRGPNVSLGVANLGGAALLTESDESHPLGPGVEKSWHAVVTPNGASELHESRFTASGSVAPGYFAMPPLLIATPQYYASTRAWGVIALPVTGAGDRQTEFDRFEKMQLAKVSASAVETLPHALGETVWTHLATDLASWNDYGDLRWAGNGCGTFSGNHYDWPYGMYLQMMRTGRLEFADAARVMAQHEIDLDIYHTNDDGPAFNQQKEWEDRPSHASPDNCFGPGRPTHTWTQGYALHWLLTGDRRGLDAFNELQDGIRQYLYNGFVNEALVNTDEIRTNGWIADNLVARWRIEPDAMIETQSGPVPITDTIRQVLVAVFQRELAAGSKGFVFAMGPDDERPDPNLRAPLQILYFIEPAIKVADEVFREKDSGYAKTVIALVTRMTDFIMASTYGGDTRSDGRYRPRQIPSLFDVQFAIDSQKRGEIPYLLMAANAAGFVYSETKDTKYRDYARAAFTDYVRYYGVIEHDTYDDPALRTPAAYNSAIFTGTESKVHGWQARYGQYYLATELTVAPPPPPPEPVVPARRRAVGRH